MTAADDEIRALLNDYRQLGVDLSSTLVSRGWNCVNPEADGDETIEWVWPPTAPVGYRGMPEWISSADRLRPHKYVPRHTPWQMPTRLLQAPRAHWELRYGEALAQHPDETRRYADDVELINDLERIESWPMSVEECRRVEMGRLWSTTIADAWNAHYLGMTITDPYGSRLDAIEARWAARDWAGVNETRLSDLDTGDLHAQRRLVDAEAWASAIRTARAGGPGWEPDGSGVAL